MKIYETPTVDWILCFRPDTCLLSSIWDDSHGELVEGDDVDL